MARLVPTVRVVTGSEELPGDPRESPREKSGTGGPESVRIGTDERSPDTLLLRMDTEASGEDTVGTEAFEGAGLSAGEDSRALLALSALQ